MKVKVKREDLIEAIQTLQNVISPRVTLPVLANFLLETQKDALHMVATDLEIGISKSIPAEIQEEGKITVPAKRFSEIIKELSPENEINIAVKKNNSIHLTYGSSFFKLMGIPAEEFPKIPKIEKEEDLILNQKELKNMLELTIFAVSREEARYVLNGIFFDLKEQTLNLVATDGRRLSLVTKNLEKSNPLQMIVPLKTVQELNRLLKEEGEVKIIQSENQVCFKLDETLIISRLLEGNFPDYQQVIPEEKRIKLKIKKEPLLQAIRRVSLFTTAESISIKIEVFKDKMVISKIVPEIGEAREELPIEYAGKELAIGFNPYYLIDVLKNIKEEEIPLELEDVDKPGVIRLANFIHIVLPMQLV
ncbi:MAG: DNA polymerase III subunit beta [Candidatus Omnitrophica bacterium]|nr:DNA polymerase III subunit beta [Candidatus Omnitrophota bacterium]